MRTLEPLELPGIHHVTLIHKESIGFRGDVRGRTTLAGFFAHGARSSEVSLFTEHGDRKVAIGDRGATLRHDAGPTCDVHGPLLALACTDALHLLNVRTGEWTVGPSLRDVTAATCTFDAEGTLWLLTQVRHDFAHVQAFALNRYDAPVAERVLDVADGDDGGWWLDRPHTARNLVPVSAGMGQNGSVTAFVELGREGITLRNVVRDACFAGWTPSCDAYALLGHHDNALSIVSGRGSITRDLEALLEAIDDGHNYYAVPVGESRVLLPTGEGRLLLIDMQDDGATEVLLRGDDRNWDWGGVALLGDRLLTFRHRTEALDAWDATPLSAPLRAAPPR